MPESRLHEYVPGLKMRQLDWAGGSNMFLILFLICFEYGYDLQNPIVFLSLQVEVEELPGAGVSGAN